MSFSRWRALFDNKSMIYSIAVCLGLVTGYCDISAFHSLASGVSEIFINLLKLVSLPIIFLSIISTASGMESLAEIKNIGKKVVKYTLGTTIVAATIALGIYMIVDPVKGMGDLASTASEVQSSGSYVNYLFQAIPSNIVQPFSENNVVGVLFLAILLSLAILSLPDSNRKVLHSFFSSLYAAIMKITTTLIRFMPFAVWAFVTLFYLDLKGGLEASSLALYLSCVVIANLVQAIIVLPAMLKLRGISPWSLFKQMSPALSIAFFGKSSSAALPMAISCATERAGISKKTANFSLPLCTTINMNACAAFILTTVLFVSMSNGVVFSYGELILWIFIATAAAVGNAGVPMGCYFLSSAILASMNVPLNILGVILPFYALIDMLESAINVWSDCSVTAAVDYELAQEEVVKEIPSSDNVTAYNA
ncbi:MAG: dicarboxylate/amino acid:cation symporter [Chlamydiales bacterium]